MRAVKILRAEAGLTGIELAKRANMSRSQLSRIEHERHEPKPESLKRIADALDINVRDIYALEEEIYGPKAGGPPSPAQAWLLERIAGHALVAMNSEEFSNYVDGLDLQGLQEAKEDLDLERSHIEHAFMSALGHPVGARVEIVSPLFRSLKVAWQNYVYSLREIDRRRKELREELRGKTKSVLL